MPPVACDYHTDLLQFTPRGVYSPALSYTISNTYTRDGR